MAASLTFPNVNEALIRMGGRIGPVAAARLLLRARRRGWQSCRVFTLGVKQEFRQDGVGARLYRDTLLAARRRRATGGAR